MPLPGTSAILNAINVVGLDPPEEDTIVETAPAVSKIPLLPPLNIAKTFVRLREIAGDVACLDLGRKYPEYRGILKINCINYALMSESEQIGVIEGFKAFLNGLSFPIQILVRNLPHNLNDYVRKMDSIEGNLAEMAHDHAQFVRVLSSTRVLVKREYYIIVPANYQGISDPALAMLNAQMLIKLRTEELLRQLERMGLLGKRLTSEEIVNLYQSCFTLQDAQLGQITDTMLRSANKLTISSREDHAKEIKALKNPKKTVPEWILLEEQEKLIAELKQVAADEKEAAKDKQKRKQDKSHYPSFSRVSDLIAPGSLQILPSYLRIDGEMEPQYSKILALTKYPRTAYPGWFDSIIQLDEPYVDFCIHINPLSPERVYHLLQRKTAYFRGAAIIARYYGRMGDPSSSIALGDVENLHEKLVRGSERVFSINAYIHVRGADPRILRERSDRLISMIRSLDFRAQPVHWQHHLGLLSCLPDGHNALAQERLFGTGAAATFFPFTGSDISMESGAMFGVHAHGGLILINPFNSQQLENANMVVFAKSGSGKSFFLKTVSARLLSTCNIYVIDPEAEYHNLCKEVKGQYIRLSTQSLQINPFELYAHASNTPYANEEVKQEEGNFFREKLLNMLTLLELLLSDAGKLQQREKAFLYKCLIKTYENRGITMDPATHNRQPPNMHEFFVILSSANRGDDRFSVGQDSYSLTERLERYLHLFPAKTNITLKNRYIDFNIRELNETLKPVGLFMITEFLWTKMRQARRSNVVDSNTIILIDEAWLLMRFQQGAKFLEEFARRIRKYGGGLWCTTQNSDDFLNSMEGKTILAMSTMKFLMKQDASTIDSVANTFRLSHEQRAFLLSARRGEGLFATKSWAQMEVLASPREAEMANTTLISLSQLPKEQKEKHPKPGKPKKVPAKARQ